MKLRDDRVKLFLNTGLIVLLGACALAAVGFLSPSRSIPVAGNGAVSDQNAVSIAKEYLGEIGQMPGEIAQVKAERYWVPANRFWDALAKGKSIPLKPRATDCWVVTFFYTGLHPESWKAVFVEVKSGKVVGGSWCKH